MGRRHAREPGSHIHVGIVVPPAGHNVIDELSLGGRSGVTHRRRPLDRGVPRHAWRRPSTHCHKRNISEGGLHEGKAKARHCRPVHALPSRPCLPSGTARRAPARRDRRAPLRSPRCLAGPSRTTRSRSGRRPTWPPCPTGWCGRVAPADACPVRGHGRWRRARRVALPHRGPNAGHVGLLRTVIRDNDRLAVHAPHLPDDGGLMVIHQASPDDAGSGSAGWPAMGPTGRVRNRSFDPPDLP
jgi:hypothetical protein